MLDSLYLSCNLCVLYIRMLLPLSRSIFASFAFVILFPSMVTGFIILVAMGDCVNFLSVYIFHLFSHSLMCFSSLSILLASMFFDLPA